MPELTAEQQKAMVRMLTTVMCENFAAMAEECAKMPNTIRMTGREALLQFAEAMRQAPVDKWGVEARA